MKTFRVITESTVVTEYLVDAETAEEAMDNFWEGSYYSDNEVEYKNEEVMNVEEIVQSNG